MKIVKYSIDESGIPILFKTKILHADVVIKSVSAGYAIISYDEATDKFSVKCYGGSESLKISSNRKDCVIIENYLNSTLCNFENNALLSTCKFNSLVLGNDLVNETEK